MVFNQLGVGLWVSRIRNSGGVCHRRLYVFSLIGRLLRNRSDQRMSTRPSESWRFGRKGNYGRPRSSPYLKYRLSRFGEYQEGTSLPLRDGCVLATKRSCLWHRCSRQRLNDLTQLRGGIDSFVTNRTKQVSRLLYHVPSTIFWVDGWCYPRGRFFLPSRQ